jgi:hypothetical protein
MAGAKVATASAAANSTIDNLYLRRSSSLMGIIVFRFFDRENDSFQGVRRRITH